MYLVLDTETTGIPDRAGWNKYYPPHILKHYEGARVVQITAKLGEEILDVYIKPEGFIIENSEIHGVTQNMAEERGITFSEAGYKFLDMLLRSDKIVGHNVPFDYSVLLSEAHRHGIKDLYSTLMNKEFEDTMHIAKLKYRKRMKLDDLYSHLFKKERIEEQKHNSLYDVLDTEMCYQAMI